MAQAQAAFQVLWHLPRTLSWLPGGTDMSMLNTLCGTPGWPACVVAFCELQGDWTSS